MPVPAKKTAKSPVKRVAKKAVVPANGLHSVLVSGKAYEAGVKNFKIKPIGLIKRGLGVQHKYEMTLDDARELRDLMLEIASPLELDDYNEAVDEAIGRDLSRFPNAVRPF
jgi:hypothetical protein